MTQSTPAGAAKPAGRGAPLLICAELPGNVLEWADALRRAHFPPERNRLRAHVTLFHALPPSSEPEVRRLLGDLSGQAAPDAAITGLINLGNGTAIALSSPGMVSLHDRIAERLHGLLSSQDSQPLRLHITVQNKVTPQVARTLQAELAADLPDLRFRFRGLGLYAYEGGPWRPISAYPFRGRG